MLQHLRKHTGIISVHGTLRAALVATLAIFASACSGPSAVTYQGQAGPNINRDERGRPLSVVVHVHQLKSSQAFSRLTSEALASGKSEAELLGADLLASRELVLLPGSKFEVEEEIREDTRYIGVVGFFRRPDPQFWRLLLDADAVRSKDLQLKVEDCYLQAIKPLHTPIPGQPKVFRASCPAA